MSFFEKLFNWGKKSEDAAEETSEEIIAEEKYLPEEKEEAPNDTKD